MSPRQPAAAIAARRPLVVAVEMLEGRALLAAATINLIGTELRIDGDGDRRNTIRVDLNDQGQIVATANRTTHTFAPDAVTVIRVGGGPFNDRVRIDAGLTVPALVWTFGGNDVVYGGGGGDQLWGGAGNDQLDGRGGADGVWGEAGDDLLRAPRGTEDAAYGGPGRDRVLGGAADKDPDVADAPPVERAPAPAVRAFAWRGLPAPSGGAVVPMVWVRTADEPDAYAAGQRAAGELLARAAGDRVAFLFSALNAWFARDPLQVIREGPEAAGAALGGYFADLFRGMRDAGAVPDRLVLDLEAGVSVWHLFAGLDEGTGPGAPRAAAMRRVYDDPQAYAQLPPELRKWAPADFGDPQTPRGLEAYRAWDRWAAEFRARAVRGAVAGPAAQAFGRVVPVSNFGDTAAPTPVADHNGWPLPGSIVSSVSAPQLYLWTANAQWNGAKDPRWNRLIQGLNTVRAALGKPGATVEPWVSFPGFRGDDVPAGGSPWLWEQLVRHAAAAGVTSFYLWDPPAGQPDPFGRTPESVAREDAFVAQLFQQLAAQPAASAAVALPQIPMDADEIVTGGVRTTYADFLAKAG